jgi:hypothetical protein
MKLTNIRTRARTQKRGKIQAPSGAIDHCFLFLSQEEIEYGLSNVRIFYFLFFNIIKWFGNYCVGKTAESFGYET